MRVLKEIAGKACKVTVFSWNEKYLIKLEHHGLEQTFKVSEFDVLEQELEELLSDEFMNSAMTRFDDMARSLGQSMSKL
jgi:hypothetical protein